MGRRKSTKAQFEDEEEVDPALNDEMIEAENQYGIAFRSTTDFFQWRELQGLNRQLVDNTSHVQSSTPHTSASAPACGPDLGSGQQKRSAAPATTATTTSGTPCLGSRQQQIASHAAAATTASTTSGALNPGSHQQQVLSRMPTGPSISNQSNAAGPSERLTVSARIPDSKMKFLIGKGGGTIRHLKDTWTSIRVDLRTQSEVHTLKIHGERSDLERFLLQIGSLIDEDILRFLPEKTTSTQPSATPSSSQPGQPLRQQAQLVHRHFTVPLGVAGRLIGKHRSLQQEIERKYSVQIAFFEKDAASRSSTKCRISATTDEAIQRSVSEMNGIIRPAQLCEASRECWQRQQPAEHVLDQRVNERESVAHESRDSMNMQRCNRGDFTGYRRGLSVANLGKIFPPPTNIAIPGLTAEEEDFQVTAETGLLSAAVEIEKIEQSMKAMLPVQHATEALHANALWKAYLAAFLYVADNLFRQCRPPAETIRVYSFSANWTFAQIKDLLEGNDVVDVVRKRHGVNDYTLSSKGFVTFRTVTEAEKADEDAQKWSDAGLTVEKMRTEECATTGQQETNWKMFDIARLMRLRLIHAILNDEGFSGERWRSRPFRQQREYYKRHHEEHFGSRRQQPAAEEVEADAQNGVKLRDSKHMFQIRRALYSYFDPTHFERKRATDHESYRWPREDVFEHLDRIYAADNSTLEDIKAQLRYFDVKFHDDMFFQWHNRAARWSANIEPPSDWQWLSIPEHYEVHEMIDTAEGLRRWATYIRSLPFDEAIALDMEGSTDGPIGLQLAQFSTFHKACIVDFAKCHKMTEFTELLEAIYYSKALKCDHDGKDFSALSRFLPGTKVYRYTTTPYLINHFNLPKKKSLGLDHSPRIGHFVAEYLGVMMRKGMATSAWNHRPLTKGQTLYALLDAVAVALLARRCYEEGQERFLALARADYARATQRP